MKTFKVETYEENSHSWEGVNSFKPEYIFKRVKVPRRWWFRWFKRTALVCMSPQHAEHHAEEKALELAHVLHRHAPTRVQEITVLSGHKDTETLWMNGKFVGHHAVPIWSGHHPFWRHWSYKSFKWCWRFFFGEKTAHH